MYHYKARLYSPTLGRFMQTDPIGYEDGMNMYAYTGNDPMNKVDPSGESDLNLFSPAEALFAPSERLSIPGTFTVTAHGTPRDVVDKRTGPLGNRPKRRLNARQLANEARKAGHKKGVPIFLLACNCGARKFASDLARAAQSSVISSAGFVRTTPAKNGGPIKIETFSERGGKGQKLNFMITDANGKTIDTGISSIRFNSKTGVASYYTRQTRAGSRISRNVKIGSKCIDKDLCD